MILGEVGKGEKQRGKVELTHLCRNLGTRRRKADVERGGKGKEETGRSDLHQISRGKEGERSQSGVTSVHLRFFGHREVLMCVFPWKP